MINILILSHCELTKELIKTAEVIAGKQENLFYIDQDIKNENLASLQEKISEILKKVNNEKGTLILTDMLGGTPCNASVLLTKNFNIEVLTGVNLPMILSAVFASRTVNTAKDLADKVLADGKKSIVNAKQLLLERMK
ncbi:PTS sugar transporter subunit IIA [Candidatus Ruminimicrobiellum ovillum]|uniref:PTS sugar transporter subunit IIA n=1 Tax=Candidatus Ruminimicrobiellum ovillum TaxID=1947927 RepID=UPI00355A5512